MLRVVFRDITLKPDADNTDERRKTMSENKKSKQHLNQKETNIK